MKGEELAAMKAAMMPQIDAALEQFLGTMTATMETVSQAEVDRCIGVVESCAMEGKPTWNTAINFAADRLREWKTAARSAETGSAGAPKGTP